MKKTQTERKTCTIDAGSAEWARQRVAELQDSETDIGVALEMMERVPELLRAGAGKMVNQPEANMAHSFANDFERLISQLQETFEYWQKDRKSLDAGIRKYERREQHAVSE